MKGLQENRREYCQCYRCDEGCIHVVCGPAMVRLTPSQFAELTEAVRELADQLKSEQLQESRIC